MRKKLNPCPKCGSGNIDGFVRVRCLDCGAKTKRVWTGETQTEIELAASLWNKGQLERHNYPRQRLDFWGKPY